MGDSAAATATSAMTPRKSPRTPSRCIGPTEFFSGAASNVGYISRHAVADLFFYLDVTESEPAAGEETTAVELLRDALQTHIARIEEELALIDRQHRHLSARIEECRERAEE